jgi:hypothetical protein
MGTSLNDYEINIALIIIGAGLELTLTVSRKGAMMDDYDQVANPNLIPCFEFLTNQPTNQPTTTPISGHISLPTLDPNVFTHTRQLV